MTQLLAQLKYLDQIIKISDISANSKLDKLKIIDLRVKDRMIIKLNVGDTNFKESNV